MDQTIAAAKPYLARREDLIAAYLFGSRAEGVARPHSDVDVALLFRSELDQDAVWEARLEIGAALARVCRRSVDAVVLNTAPPLLRFQVLRHGQLLLDRDAEMRCRFAARWLAEYYDAKRYLAFRSAELIRRIRQEGIGAGYRGDRDAAEQARQLRGRLAALSADTLPEYLADENMQMIVERRLQLAIQVCIDIANYLVARLGLRLPEEQENVFAVLGSEGGLPPELAQRMVGMVRFRNILVHDYLDIDARRVYAHLTEGLSDFDQFSRAIADRFLAPPAVGQPPSEV